MSCSQKLDDKINDMDEHSALIVAMQKAENDKRVRSAIRRAQINGRYALPGTLSMFSKSYSELVGKTITLEAIDTYEFKEIKVKSAEEVANRLISINNGEVILDLDSKMTRDGMWTLGSEDIRTEEGLTKLTEISGTVLQDLNDLANDMLDTDTEMGAISNSHKTHLLNVFNKYENILKEASKDIDLNVVAFEDLNERNNTRGEADPELGIIKLILGNQKNNSLSEILGHELQHVMLRNTIKSDKQLQYNILKLREALKEHFATKYGKGNEWMVFTDGRKDPDEADAKMKYEYVFNHSKYPADEFLAYATTNEQLVKQLGLTGAVQLDGILPTVKETGKWTKLWNRVASAINVAFNAYKNHGKTGRQLAMDMLDVALTKSQGLHKKADQSVADKLIDKITNVDRRIAEYTGAINKEYASYAEYLASKDKNRIQKAINSIWRIKALAKARSFVLQNAIFSSVTKDMDNPDIARFYEMFRKSKAFVEKGVVAVKNKTADVLENLYEFNKLNTEQKIAVKKLFVDADASAIGSLDVVKAYLDDDKLLLNDINELTQKYDSRTLYAMDELAELLVHNKMSMKNGYVNAAQIAMNELRSTKSEDIDEVDKVVSMLALNKLDKKIKYAASKSIELNYSGIDKMLVLKKADEEKVLKNAYYGDRMYQVKGAKQEVYKTDKKHYLVNEKEMKELVKAGMHNVGKQIELSRVLGEDTYMVIGDSIDVTYTEGLMSVIQLKSEGDSIRNILAQKGKSDGDISDIIGSLAAERGTATQALIPERSGNGGIYDYKFRLPQNVKSNFLDMDENIVVTIASTVSNLTHKQEAMLNNRAALKYFKDLYSSYKDSDKYKFVEISEKSKGKLKDYWDQLPFYMKREINMNHKGKLMIEESMLVDFFGYKDASMINLPWVKDKKRRQMIAKKLEAVVQDLVANWKKQIVVFTAGTVQGNMFSNMLVAIAHMKNKNPIAYIEKFKEVWTMMNTYQEDRSKLIELQIRRDAGEKITDKQIAAVEAKMNANPVSIIVEDGQYNAILEDINTEFFDNNGILNAKFEELLGKIKREKTREGLKSLIDTIYARKGTRVHDSIMKLTTYSDAINKMIILMDKMEHSDSTITQKDLNEMDKLHVNYGYLDNRYIKYANDLGFLTFTKYFFRVFPAMFKMLSNKMLTVALMESSRKLIGVGETPFEQFYNPFDSVFKKVGLTAEPDNLLGTLITPFWIR